MPRSKRDRLALVAASALVLVGCSRAEPAPVPPAPNPFPVYDGVPRSGIHNRKPLRIDPGPDSTYLFNRVLDCYPARSWFRPELSVELRAGQRSTTYDGGTVGSGGALVLRAPLYSESDIERERDREAARRQKVAASVSAFLENLVAHRLVDRELEIWKASEAWSANRVAAGAAPTAEQADAEKRVYMLEIKRVEHLAKVVSARLELVGMCSSDKGAALSAYLKAYNREEPGQRADEVQDMPTRGGM